MPLFTGGGANIGSAQIIDGAIVDADVSASAAIQASKITGKPYELLADVSLGAAAATLASGAITTCRQLRVVIYVPSLAAIGDVYLQFNGDTGANYANNIVLDGGGAVKTVAQTQLKLDTFGTTAERHYVVDIENIASLKKHAACSTYNFDSAAVVNGHWTNAANAITSITLGGTANLNSGTRMAVYGIL